MARRGARNRGPSPAVSSEPPQVHPPRLVDTEPGRVAEGQKWLQAGISVQPYLIVFVASACGLIIEIVAARILAPTIGVSLYTWTSVIGVVLAGISVGNYLGGRVADRFPSSKTLGLVLLAASVSSLGILPIVGPVSGAFEALPIVPRIVLLTATLFFPASLILGMVTPLVIKLKLRDLAHTGNVVGKVYALSTAGAIFGTFITGFVLVQWIGTRQTLFVVALVLLLMALAFGNLWRARVQGISLVVVFLALMGVSFANGSLDSACLRESNYYCISVSEATVEGGRRVKVLRLDKLLHSYVSPEDPTLFVYGYMKVLADLENYVAQRNPSSRFLFVGGGGYTMPRYLEEEYPQSTVEVIEIDPEVTVVAFQYLGLRPDTRIVTYNEDARMAVPKLPRGQYDMIVGDAFHDVSIPYHLTSLEFNESIAALLNEQGIYFVNVVDRLHSGRFLRAYVNTLLRTFRYVYLVRNEARWESDNQETYGVVASLQPLWPAALEGANRQAGRPQPVTRFMPEDAFEAWLHSVDNVLLTDNYAPVENLMAPIYVASIDLSQAERHYNVGLELQGQGQLLEAIEEYGQAVRLDPQLDQAYLNRGRLNNQLGQYEMAIQDLDRAIRLSPNSAVAHTVRGTAYAVQGRFQLAIRDLDEALRIDPQHVDAYINRGTAHAVQGQHQLAIRDLTDAIRLDPWNPQTYAGRAVLYTVLGQDEQAQENFDIAVELGYDPIALKAEIDGLKK